MASVITKVINGKPYCYLAVSARVEGKPRIVDQKYLGTAEVIAGYRSQSHAEFSFHQLKNPHAVSFSPLHHWTQAHIHALYRALALMITHLMRRTAHQTGLHLSIRELLAPLAGIQETVLLYPGTRGCPKARRMITDRTDLQQQLYEALRTQQMDASQLGNTHPHHQQKL